MTVRQAQDFKLTPKEKKILTEVLQALVDPNKPAIVETVDADVNGNTIIWNKDGENPRLPDKVGTRSDDRYQNAVAARSIKLGEDITITYEKSKFKIHAKSGDLTVGDGNWDALTAWRLALMKYKENNNIKRLKDTRYEFKDSDLHAIYTGISPELDKSSEFEKATNKLKAMGITKFKFMNQQNGND